MIVVVHGPYEPWLSILKEGQIKTWMSNPDSIRIVNAFGKKIGSNRISLDQKIYFLRWHRNKIIAYLALAAEALIKYAVFLPFYKPKSLSKIDPIFGEVWEVQMPDSLLLQGVKNLSIFREALNHDFDFLVTTITSTYLNLSLLNKFLHQFGTNEFLGGRIELSGKTTYQQGSFRIYSKDVVTNIVKNSFRYKHWRIEDIAMGKLVAKMYSKFVNMKNLTISEVEDIEKLSHLQLNETISYRCKSFSNNMRFDALIMKNLHLRLNPQGIRGCD